MTEDKATRDTKDEKVVEAPLNENNNENNNNHVVTDDDDDDNDNDNDIKKKSSSPEVPAWSQNWTNIISMAHRPVGRLIVAIADRAASNPKSYVIGTIVFSLAIVAIGFFTNFNVNTDEDMLWTPIGSKPIQHSDWIETSSGFPEAPRFYQLLVHAKGDNVATHDGVERAFIALDTVRNSTNYQQVCSKSVWGDCQIWGVTQFWNNSMEDFLNGDEDILVALSATTLPDGTPIDRSRMFGAAEFNSNDQLVSALSFTLLLYYADVDEALDMETDGINRLIALDQQWEADPTTAIVVDQRASRSFPDEFARAIVKDIPLVPLVFVIMSLFTCFVFAKRDWVASRSLLGFGAVVCVLLSIMTGYGFLFLIGVPFTSLTQILPFIMFGIGLDDAFIISGAYLRTDRSLSSEQRIRHTMEDVGLSVFLTTMTSTLAFVLGALSVIPAIRWLCLYAFPTIVIDFIYQITFFIALIAIDERRIEARKMDCLVCFTCPNRHSEDNSNDEEGEVVEELQQEHAQEEETTPQEIYADAPARWMSWVATQLFRPWVAALVIVGFAGLCAGFGYQASKLAQAFRFTDVVPSDSYLIDMSDAIDAYAQQSETRPYIYFRNVDQSDPIIQDQMEQYVKEISALPTVSGEPSFFWLRDFKQFVNETASVQAKEFSAQMDDFLSVPKYDELYSTSIVRDKDGNVFSSRTTVQLILLQSVEEQINLIQTQRAVSERQPLNSNNDDWSFFVFDKLFFIWEFYSVCVEELTLSTILGVAAVIAIALVFIPHWTAAFFIAPLIVMLYIELLGVLHTAGLHINALSYVSLLMSIGLFVDFLMHVLLRYYESTEKDRKAKVRDTLETMGSSVLIGALSTFLGVMPLAFSSTQGFYTLFITFLGLVTLGASHGLILLPVLLSLFGPVVSIHPGIGREEPTITSTADDIQADIDNTKKNDPEHFG